MIILDTVLKVHKKSSGVFFINPIRSKENTTPK